MFIGCYHMAQYCPCLENEPDIKKKLMILLVEFGNGANLLI
jgi:hypothetical protein